MKAKHPRQSRSSTSSASLALALLCCTILAVLSVSDTTHALHPPIEATLQAGLNHVDVSYDGLNRDVTIQLPVDFSPTTLYPVVFFFHGLGGNKGMGQALMGSLVNEEQFVGVYPQGHLNSWNTGGNEIPSTADDVGFTLHLLDWLGTVLNVDSERVFSLGYSNGGAFSYTLALTTEAFAAIASLSASLRRGLTIPKSTRPLSVIQIHGELDAAVPFDGGQSSYLPIAFESAEHTVQAWAQHNELNGEPAECHPERNLTLFTFAEEGNPHEVRLYVMHETTHDIGTHPFVSTLRCYREIWDFFKAHPRTG
jgi:polyhydroxybutyrate depolymerase